MSHGHRSKVWITSFWVCGCAFLQAYPDTQAQYVYGHIHVYGLLLFLSSSLTSTLQTDWALEVGCPHMFELDRPLLQLVFSCLRLLCFPSCYYLTLPVEWCLFSLCKLELTTFNVLWLCLTSKQGIALLAIMQRGYTDHSAATNYTSCKRKMGLPFFIFFKQLKYT